MIPLVQIIDEFQQESLQWPWYWLISSFTVEPLYNGHLGDRRKWPLERSWNKSDVWNVRQKKWPLYRGGGWWRSTAFRREIIKLSYSWREFFFFLEECSLQWMYKYQMSLEDLMERQFILVHVFINIKQ